jgi:ABC-type cobalt transport system substrate-binding protein
MSNSNNIDWDDVIKKEARGSDDEDLGEVKEIDEEYVSIFQRIWQSHMMEAYCDLTYQKKK